MPPDNNELAQTPPSELQATAELILREIDRFQRSAPFVAYVHAQKDGRPHHFFIPRHNRPGHPSPSSHTVDYVSYHAPVGRLAAARPGQEATVTIPRVSGQHVIGVLAEDLYTVLAKDLFRCADSDALDNTISFPSASVAIASLRRYLVMLQDAQTEAVAAELAKPRRRRTIDKFELQDIAIVDPEQDNIFRTPVSAFILITGAPGTGKTTTTIKRLANKTKLSHLLENGEIAQQEADALRPLLSGPANWALFTPSDLLRGYLKEALNQEDLPAPDDHVLVWRDYSVLLCRDVLNFLKVGSRGEFVCMPGLIANRNSRALADWTKEFLMGMSQRVASELHHDVTTKTEQLQRVLTYASAEAERINTAAQPLKAEITKLEASLASATSEKAQDQLRRSINPLQRKLDDLREPAQQLLFFSGVWRRIRALADSAQASPEAFPLGRFARSAAELQGEVTTFLDQRRQASPRQSPPSPREHESAGGDLRNAASAIIQSLTLDTLLRRIPIVYQQFRLANWENHQLFHKHLLPTVNEKKLDYLELDTLIFAALVTTRGAFDGVALVQQAGSSASQRLLNSMRLIVAVDEASDFSATELACMALLAHPRFNSVTLAGDLMQRMTKHGVSDWGELAILHQIPVTFDLKVSYRQSPKLLKIAGELWQKTIGTPPPFSSAYATTTHEPDALHFGSADAAQQAAWMADRIVEVFAANNHRLPSIAVFVPSEDAVRHVSKLLSEALQPHNIPVEPCHDGKVLGTQAKVRAFNVEFIKGLEFEAVFFVEVDKLAQSVPELVDRYLYVGLTRARSFLAVTSANGFPAQLRHVEQSFLTSDWKRFAESSTE